MKLIDVIRQMPRDWEDVAGWDQYYTLLCESGYHLEELLVMFDFMVLEDCLIPPQRSHPKIWFPGCGVTLLPRFCALGGFRVWASDISSVAIRFCKEMEKDLAKHEKLSSFAKPITKGELHYVQHDLRTPFVQSDFDYIADVKTFQRLSPESKKKAARIYRESLTQGGQAVFILMNVKKEYHDQIKEIIRQAGFCFMKREAEMWYYRTLSDSGIPHTFRNRQLFIQKENERYQGATGKLKLKRDQVKFNHLRREYLRRVDKEIKGLRQLAKETDTGIAELSFWTG